MREKLFIIFRTVLMVILGVGIGLGEVYLAGLAAWNALQCLLLGLTVGSSVAFSIFLFWKSKRTEPGYANILLYHINDALLVQAILLVVATIFGGIAAIISAVVSAVLLVAHIIIGIKELVSGRYYRFTGWARMSLYPLISGALGLAVSLLLYFVDRGLYY